jgi:hypothetical protein
MGAQRCHYEVRLLALASGTAGYPAPCLASLRGSRYRYPRRSPLALAQRGGCSRLALAQFPVQRKRGGTRPPCRQGGYSPARGPGWNQRHNGPSQAMHFSAQHCGLLLFLLPASPHPYSYRVERQIFSLRCAALPWTIEKWSNLWQVRRRRHCSAGALRTLSVKGRR